MSKILNTEYAASGSASLLECIDDLGCTNEEAIPALVETILLLAQRFRRPDDVLDEVAEMIADGEVIDV
jgi:hypothetical protein